MEESVENAVQYFNRSVNHQLKFYETLLDGVSFKDTAHVFELGCGTGAMSARLAKEIVPNGRVTACDPEENRIRLAVENFSDIPHLDFIHGTGSATLENKKDVYDVILSNAVLHWIKEDELEITMDRMFTALKSGGIAAHNFIEGIPNTYKILGKIDKSKVEKLLETVHPIQEEAFAALARKAGFVIVNSRRRLHETEVDTEENLLKLVDASTFGLFEWEKTYNCGKDRGIFVKFEVTETGKFAHRSSLVSFILKKP